MTELKRMLSGKLYMANDEKLKSIRKEMLEKLHVYNHLDYLEDQKRDVLIKEILGGHQDTLKITPPVYFDYGKNTFVGKDFYANADCIFLDVNTITIKDRVMLGPRVSLLTATHPIDAGVRATQLEYGLPIVIEEDCWIGGMVVINPGVTIGARSIIGSGSVVTKDIPSDVIAVGNPCRVLRKITEADKIYWEAQKLAYENNI